MEVMELLTQAVEQNAADIFLVPGMPFSYKIGGRIICQGEEKIMPDQLDQISTYKIRGCPLLFLPAVSSRDFPVFWE